MNDLQQENVVSYFNSTSNHNTSFGNAQKYMVVSYFNSTSNHNFTMNRLYAI